MATSMVCLVALCLVSPLLLAGAVLGNPGYGGLFPQFYDHSCPKAKEIVHSIVAQAVARETRMAASLVRLHFHDCFVKGCDASVLLDNSTNIVSEKGSNPNKNSIRGFEVVDEIKVALETACPGTVSCADILALAARDSTILVGGPYWDVPLGRRDSLGASIQGSNNDIPAPNNTLPTIITKFKRLGLNIVDVVALSGGHTIGFFPRTSFRQRLYNQSDNGLADSTLDVSYAAQLRQGCPRSGGDDNLFPLDIVTSTKFDNFYFKNILAGRGLLSSDLPPSQRLYNQSDNGLADSTLDVSYAAQLRQGCPRSGGDDNLFPLDIVTSTKFDNFYFKNILAGRGLLSSDEVLLTKSAETAALVKAYANDVHLFFQHFAQSMVNMGNISPLTGSQGEIRKNCRRLNNFH
ncbi:Peroxidase 72 [Triticum urartu]|uniref:Peroxidase n=1 Tax=Triticum urartu TaxID=4572 RepID=M7Z843_TRIUA|nr:Peroxidase 72 [Triticum urartu]